MKIVEGNNLSQSQEEFNQKLCSVRQIIERTIGLLKVRFRCIMGERKLRYTPTKVGRIIYSCATLHNFLILNKFNILRDVDNDMLANIIDSQNVPQSATLPQDHLQSGEIRRNEIIDLFNTAQI